jgi:hypothetical protein
LYAKDQCRGVSVICRMGARARRGDCKAQRHFSGQLSDQV